MKTLSRVTIFAGLLLAVAVLAACEGNESTPMEAEAAAGTAVEAEPSQALDPISIEPLTERHEFTDAVDAQIRLMPEGRSREVVNLRDASNMAVLEITVQPGAAFPWHTHPGPALAAVTQSELVYIYADDCVRRPYGAGEAFVDPGGDNVHTAHNPTGEEAVVIVTFLDAPADPNAPLTIPVDPDEGEALSERCEFDA